MFSMFMAMVRCLNASALSVGHQASTEVHAFAAWVTRSRLVPALFCYMVAVCARCDWGLSRPVYFLRSAVQTQYDTGGSSSGRMLMCSWRTRMPAMRVGQACTTHGRNCYCLAVALAPCSQVP